MPVAGAKRHRENLESPIAQKSGRLEKLRVITNRHTNAGGGRVDHPESLPTENSLLFAFLEGGLELGLVYNRALRQADETNFSDLIAHAHMVAAADRSELEFESQNREKLLRARSELGELADPLVGGNGVCGREQLQGNQLGQQPKVTVIIRRNIDKVKNLLGKIIEGFDFTHWMLHEGHPHFAFPRRAVIRVEPFHERGAMKAAQITQVMRQDTSSLKALCTSRPDRGFLPRPLLQRILGRHGAGAFTITR